MSDPRVAAMLGVLLGIDLGQAGGPGGPAPGGPQPMQTESSSPPPQPKQQPKKEELPKPKKPEKELPENKKQALQEKEKGMYFTVGERDCECYYYGACLTLSVARY